MSWPLYSLTAVASIFALWYFGVGAHNAFALDDFWLAGHVRSDGFWGAQRWFYFQWEGSAAHSFLATLPYAFRPIDSSSAPVPIVTAGVGALTAAVAALFRAIAPSLRRWQAAVLAAYCVSSFFLITRGESEIRYWVTAHASYVMAAAAAVTAVAVLVSRNHSRAAAFSLCVCAALLSLHKLNFAVALLAGSVAAIVWSPTSSLTYAVRWSLLISICGLAVNVVAPGNYVRMAENIASGSGGAHWTLAGVVLHKVWTVVLPTFLLGFVPMAIAAYAVSRAATDYRCDIVVCAISVVTLLGIDSGVMWLAFRDPGPLRANIVLEIAVLAFTFSVASRFTHTLAATYRLQASAMFVVLTVALAVYHASNWRYVAVAVSYERAAAARMRNVQAECQSLPRRVLLKPLPPPGLLHSVSMDDPLWLSNIYLPYFGCAAGTEAVVTPY